MIVRSAVVVAGILAGLFVVGALAVGRVPAQLDDLLAGTPGNARRLPSRGART